MKHLKKQISKLSLSVVENLTKKDNYEEKIEILSVTSSVVDESINKIMENAVEEASNEGDIEKVKEIVENSKGTLSNKLIDSANKNEESKKKITEVIVDIVQDNPEKAVEIIEKNKNTNTVTDTIKTKIENNEAVTSEDFEEVFDANVSPNQKCNFLRIKLTSIFFIIISILIIFNGGNSNLLIQFNFLFFSTFFYCV